MSVTSFRPQHIGGWRVQLLLLAMLFAAGFGVGTIQRTFAATTYRSDGGPQWWRNANLVITADINCGYDAWSQYGSNINSSFSTNGRWAGWDSVLAGGTVATWVDWYIPSCMGNAPNAHYRIVYNGGSNTADCQANQNNFFNQWIGCNPGGGFSMNGSSTNDYSGLTSVEYGSWGGGEHNIVWDDARYTR